MNNKKGATKLKKVLKLLFASILLVGCGHDSQSSKEDKSKHESSKKEDSQSKEESKSKGSEEKDKEYDTSEHETYKKKPSGTFKGDKLETKDYIVTIKDKEIIHDKDKDRDVVAFKFEVKNKSGKSNINASSAWIESFNILQDSKDTENKLSPSYISFRDGKYAEWDKHQRDNIKKGGTAKGIETYELQGKDDVFIVGKDNNNYDKDLGRTKVKLKDLHKSSFSSREELDKSINKELEKEDEIQDKKDHHKSEKKDDDDKDKAVTDA